MIPKDNFFREQVTKALYRYYRWEAYDKASEYESGVYAEIRAEIDFDKIFYSIQRVRAPKHHQPIYVICAYPEYLFSKYPPLVRQTRGYCNHEITDIWTYISRWLNCSILPYMGESTIACRTGKRTLLENSKW